MTTPTNSDRLHGESVLPPLPPIEGLELNRWEDLLTPEQLDKLHADLAEIAQQRRRAEAEAGGMYLG